ncbi:MAG: Gfo/Idh/MocA family oxidoreductase [Fimbriimonas sp.]|nr:Gfo/Idh/MocA family oxidoreductase [Fimbriimonas sp.]
MQPVRIGIIGVGNISGIYLKNLKEFRSTEIVAVADIDADRARFVAEKHGIPQAMAPKALLASADVEFVLNLTIPNAHGPIAIAAAQAGKHVYNEKPLCISMEDAKTLLDTAKSKGVLVGSAPDTFLGGGIQTCRALIDSGAIGEPVAANAFMMGRGHESWHPSPEFYYQLGGGPMFDMGPYYLTALVNLIGPVKRVAASARISFPTRTITSQPKAGTVIQVETPTHLCGAIDFVNGAIGQVTMSFDVYSSPLPNIVIYGSEGTLVVPDPNGFGGQPMLKQAKDTEFHAVELTHGYTEGERGIGVVDMCYAIRNGGAHRASGDLAYHVLEVMHAFAKSSDSDKHVHLESQVERPEAMRADSYADERVA